MGSFGQTGVMRGSTLVIFSFILVCCYLTMAEGRRPWQQVGKSKPCSKHCRERCDEKDMNCKKIKPNKPSGKKCNKRRRLRRTRLVVRTLNVPNALSRG